MTVGKPRQKRKGHTGLRDGRAAGRRHHQRFAGGIVATAGRAAKPTAKQVPNDKRSNDDADV